MCSVHDECPCPWPVVCLCMFYLKIVDLLSYGESHPEVATVLSKAFFGPCCDVEVLLVVDMFI